MLRRTLSSIALGLALATSAQGVPLWGTQTSVSLGDMFPSGGQNNFSFDADGPVDPVSGSPEGGAPVTHSLVDDATQLDSRGTGPWNRGVAEASAALQFGAVAAPAVLRARAVLTGNTSNQPGVTDASAFTEAFASDLFQYIGSSPTNLSITFTMTGSIANSPADPTFQTGLFASVAVFEPADYFFTSDLGALQFDIPHPVAKALDQNTLRTTASGTSTLTTTLTFAVQPGEQFYVWQKLSAWAAGDARFADAFSTMTATFDQPNLVRSLAVPEPGTAALLSAGLVGLAALSRRKRAARD